MRQLDVDIKAFFYTVDHAWMMRFLEHRIGDTRVLRLVRKWLTADVVEDGHKTAVRVGTRTSASRHDSRQEPYAVVPHVRICAGGGEQSPSLPRPP